MESEHNLAHDAGSRADAPYDPPRADGAGATADKLQRSLRQMDDFQGELELDERRLVEREVLAAQRAHQLEQRLSVRRARLKRQRELLRAESVRIRRAAQGLHDRLEQATRVLSQREEVSRLHEALQSAVGKAEASRVRAAGAKAALAVLLGVVVFAVGGWFVGDSLIPSRYRAVAHIVPSGRDAAADADLIDAWRGAMMGLMDEPAFVAQTAERLGRAGADGLDSPASVSEYLGGHVLLDEGPAGGLVMSVTDDGSARVTRVVEVLAASLVSYCNATATRRPDGTAARQSEPARRSPDPVVDRRPYVAAGFGAGGALICCGAFVIGRRALTKERAQFEELANLDALVTTARWSGPSDRRPL